MELNDQIKKYRTEINLSQCCLHSNWFSDAHFFELIKSALVQKWSEGCFIEKWLKNSNVNTRCLKQRRF